MPVRCGFALTAMVALLVGCAPMPEAPDERAPGGELTIYAAASLAGPFTEIAAEFAMEHPRVSIRPIVFDGSATLATQLGEGAPADVFASADHATLLGVAGELAGTPVQFASNRLQIAVAPGNPLGIAGLADLAD